MEGVGGRRRAHPADVGWTPTDPLLPLDIDRPLRPPEHLDRLADRLSAAGRTIQERLGWRGTAVALLVGLLAIEAAARAGAPGPSLPAAGLAAALAAGVAWQTTGLVRAGWAAIAAGVALWGGGYAARPTWAHLDPSSTRVSPGGLAAVASALLLSGALLVLIDAPRRETARLRFVAEFFLVVASVLFAGWVAVLPPAFAAVEGRPLGERAVLLSFPLGDLLLVAVVTFALTKLPALGRRNTLLLPGLAALAFVGSALSQLDPADHGGRRTVDLVVALGFLAIAAGAARAWGTGREADRAAIPERAELLMLVAPGLSILIVVGTTVRQATGQPVAVELTWITIAVLTMAVLLHVTVIVENQALGRELSLARDEAIRASELKSHFLANVSHEIRTPMNAVIGLTGLLLDTELDEDQQELAVGVATSAEGLLGLIDGLLDFSKIEAEKMELEEIDLDLTDLIDEVAMLVAEPARRQGIELIAYCDPGVATRRRGDPVRLRQVLLNLANNAVKFTSEGSVTIRAMAVERDPEKVAFLVIDTGIGIPESAQARLFEPFSQADGSTTRHYGGTGLGLGIVRGLVDLMGGKVELASEEGRGTVFRVTVPLPIAAEQRTEQGLAALVGLRALVVDGNAVQRSVLAHTLHSWGFLVDQAASAEEALHDFGWSSETEGEAGYAVALIERNLEGMDGLALARLLHREHSTAHTVILLLSPTMDLTRQAAKDAGITSVLIRPVRTSYLLRRIVDALVTPAGDPQPPTHSTTTPTPTTHPEPPLEHAHAGPDTPR